MATDPDIHTSDLYEFTDIPKDTTNEDMPAVFKKAYRKLSQKHHPDTGGSAAGWEKLVMAKEILLNPDKRKMYDSTGDCNFSNSFRGEVEKVFSEVFAQSASKFVGNIFENMRLAFDHKAQELNKEIRRIEKEIQKILEAKGNVVVKDPKGHHLVASLQRMVNDLEHQRDAVGMSLQFNNCLIEELGLYEWSGPTVTKQERIMRHFFIDTSDIT